MDLTLIWLWYMSGDWYCVQYMPFTYLGASYSSYWGHPSFVWLSERSPLYMIMKIYGYLCYDMICLGSGGLLSYTSYLYLTFYFYIITILHLLILNQCNIFYILFLFHITSLLYLFTGLFKLSRVSFPAAGFRRKLGYGWRVQIGVLEKIVLNGFVELLDKRL